MENKTSPFLRWAGGKARVSSQLAPYWPRMADGACYFEPFVGAGAMFFRLKPNKAILGDLNADLIQCFESVRNEPDLISQHLEELTHRQDRQSYHYYRRQYNESSDPIRRSALFIYLNKTCFNGIWRVNRDGQFNVPWGAKPRAGFPTLERLRGAARTLARAELVAGDFQQSVVSAAAGDAVYFDPPYLPLSATAYFRHYTPPRFGLDDHERLAHTASVLASRDVRVIVTEADSPHVRRWYRDFEIVQRHVRRYVSSNGARAMVLELLIRSFSEDTTT